MANPSGRSPRLADDPTGIEDVGSALATYVEDDGLTFPQEVHVVLASK